MREIAFKLVTYATLWGGESLLEKQYLVTLIWRNLALQKVSLLVYKQKANFAVVQYTKSRTNYSNFFFKKKSFSHENQ